MVSLIPKGEGATPDSLRPLSVMSVVYRAWAVARLRGLMRWQERWAHECLCGYRPGRSAEDVWWALALKVGRSLLEGTDLGGTAFDYSKCFDRVPFQFVLRLAESVGMSPSVCSALGGMFAQLQRCFRVGSCVGEWFRASNGILQG